MGLFGKEPDVRQMQDSGDIDGLIKALKHHKEQVRRQAAEALGRLKGARSIDPLLEALNDRSDEVRGEVLGALGGMWNDRICQSLILILSDKNAVLAKKAAALLEEKGWKPHNSEEMLCFLTAKDNWAGMAAQGDYLVEPLIKRLTDPKVDAVVKWAVAITLSYIDTPFAVQSLMKLTGDNAGYALFALENKTAGIDAASKYLINLLRGSGQLQASASRALSTLGTAALGQLAKIVLADPKNESRYTRIWALRALVIILAQTGDVGAKDVLYRIPIPPKVQNLRMDQITYFPDEEHSYHLWTVMFRRIFENPPESLVAATKSGLVSARGIGVLALSRYLDTSTMQIINSGLKDSNTEIIYASCLALAKIGSEEAAQALSALSGHEDSDIRASVAKALGSCANSTAIKTLSAMTGDSVLPVRVQAMHSLARITNLRIRR